MDTKEGRCSKTIFESRGWNHGCPAKAIVERDGKSYCRIHDPKYIEEKNRKWQEEFDEKWKKNQLRYNYNDAMRQACDGLTTEELLSLKPSRIKASNDMYEALEEIRGFVLGLDALGPTDSQVIAAICYLAQAKAEEVLNPLDKKE